jgi:hypothetical protein
VSTPDRSARSLAFLVLAGDRASGIAWMLGLIDGLRRRDADLAAADLIVGTSAGLHRGRHPPGRARAGRRAPGDWPPAADGSRRNQAEVRPPAARVGQSAGRALEAAQIPDRGSAQGGGPC